MAVTVDLVTDENASPSIIQVYKELTVGSAVILWLQLGEVD